MAFSSRLHWEFRPNRLAIALSEMRGARILDLTESNPTRAGFSYPREIVDALHDSRALVYEPSPAGLPEARIAVSEYYRARGADVDPSRIFLTASTSESYAWLFKLLADPGDTILVPRPSYPLFEYLASLESVHVAHYRLTYHGQWSVDLGRIPERASAVVVVNPNNPTGSFLKTDELGDLAGLCAERDIAIVSDEVFADYAFGPDPRRVQTLVEESGALTFCLSGLSKVAGLPQMKLGWIATGGPPKLREAAAQRLELIADTYLSVSTPVQIALPRLLSAGIHDQIADRTAANLDFLRSSVPPGSPCELLKTEGGWNAVLRVPRTRTEEEWCLDLLRRAHVLVQPGFFYDFENEAFLVLSLLTEPEVFREGIARMLSEILGV